MEEPIIIDGVDVNECAYFDYENEGTRECDAYGNECEANNCYFKQFARKTRELKTICKAFDIEYGYDEETGAIVGRCNKLIEKEKELEEYKQSLDEKNKFLQDLGISASGEFKRIKFYIEDLKNKYDEKEKELEELKEKCRALYNTKLELSRDLDHYKRAYYGCTKRIKEHLVLPAPLPPPEFLDDHYRKALEEIEEIVSKDYYDDTWADISIKIDKILDIINKAKEK